jgi:cellobiose phosphorylase
MLPPLLRRSNRSVPTAHAHASRPAFRTELLTVDQLADHARAIAARHEVTSEPGSSPLLARLDENERSLRAFNRSTLTVSPNRVITPAAEWLLDNFYLIEEQIQLARRHLPRGYSRELPRLINGASAGLPRVYDIVLELIAHVDAQMDAGPLSAFVAAYQSRGPLKLGELWAIPIMLRLGLIENLERVTSRLAVARADRNLADHWVERLQDMAEKQPAQLILVVAEMAQAGIPLSSAFVAQFRQRLSLPNPVLHLARDWLEQRLLEQGLSIDQLVEAESQSQAADQVSVSHSIASLRSLSILDWKEFVEELSAVEQTLRSDPAGVYRAMTFITRDRYRHAVEFLARRSDRAEVDVARQAIELASECGRVHGVDHRSAHVGYHLIDKGLPELGRRVRVRLPWRSLIERGIHRFPLTFYAGGIGVISLLGTYALLHLGRVFEAGPGTLLLFLPAFFLCASQLAVAVMNWLSILLAKPRLLPRLDYSAGIPPEVRTVVAVPTMLAQAEGVDRLLAALEIHHLGNRDSNLHFALLTDLPDAAVENLPGDAALIRQAEDGIRRLNRKYPLADSSRFFLFHRPRRWNVGEGLWMGYERKRGKLMEFNALLRGGSAGSFSVVVGDTRILSKIRYVITLDTDTQLPRDAARQLVGTMAHPLNRPTFDETRGIVDEGYSILQPRVGVSLPGSRRSWFVRLFAGDTGIDPYTREVSDVYQDIFQEGSFIGKGIYDVDAFQRAVGGRFPENSVLSHDLLEACHARSALVSDVEFYEEHPSRYNVDVDRRHRWIRGDWQTTQWLLPRVPGSDARRIANPLSGLSRWKILDNLRRSLVPVALVVLLLGTWLYLPASGARGALLVLAILTLPSALAALLNACSKAADLPWAAHVRCVAGTIGRQIAQIVLALAFLPYDAYVSADAVGRTLLRLLVTHRRLLEWQTSGDTEARARTRLPGFYATMWFVPALALAVGSLLLLLRPAEFLQALPLLALWLVAPGIAWWISQPIEPPPNRLTREQLSFLGNTARRTWHYFETFVTARENWLPPDNFQEIPAPTIASRTSPTNLGLALLSSLAAHDFGYLSAGGLIQRTEDTLASMARLERYRGHFYNWYDTRTLAPLLPLYVSSVDSGNLAGHLLTLAAGFREQALAPLLPPRLCMGLRDTIHVLQELTGGHPVLTALAKELTGEPASLREAIRRLNRVTEQAGRWTALLPEDVEPLQGWREALAHMAEDHRADLLRLAPWLGLPDREAYRTAPAMPALARAAEQLDQAPDLGALLRLGNILVIELQAALDAAPTDSIRTGPDERAQLTGLRDAVMQSVAVAGQRLLRWESLAEQCDTLAVMDFPLLFDATRDLFAIGFNVSEHRCDKSFYDLLASEARLCSYVAIALGQVPQDHWFSLGRLLVATRSEPVLVSWSGSMFEYLMPLLVMPSYDHTLLDATCRAAVEQQIEHARLHGVPWGISESGYHRTDVQLTYQYRGFGVPGLGLKRGLAEDLVIAPYATALALGIAPHEACVNLQRLAALGCAGRYGFFEAVDYTPSRLPPGETHVILRSFMVHHQGMSLLGLVNLLCDDPMPRRFLACPQLKAADLLLQERLPRSTARVLVDDLALESARPLAAEGDAALRTFSHPSTPTPQVQLLSNGRYHVALSNAGGGYSRWKDLAVTRWTEDSSRDGSGFFLYLRDPATGECWSPAHQPTLQPPRDYAAVFTQARVEFRQRHGDLDVRLEISVSPEDDVELRRLTVSNRSAATRTLELTSFAEVVLAPAAADAAHPAFSGLFVQTEFLADSSALLCTRRASAPEQRPPWLIHLMVGSAAQLGTASCETDRRRFIGRGGTLVHPAAMRRSEPLSNTTGAVLDPAISLRRMLTLLPHTTVEVDLVLGVVEDRATALAYIAKYQNSRMVDRAFDLAWTHSQVTLRQLNASEREARLYAQLAGALLYADPTRRAASAVLLGNRRGQSGLWSHGISGDAPIVLLQVGDPDSIDIVRQLVQAHAYWRIKGLAVELVILNEDTSVYDQSLHNQIIQLISSGIEAQQLDRPGGIFVRRLEQIPQADRLLLQAVARVILDDTHGTFAEVVERRVLRESGVPALQTTRPPRPEATVPLPPRQLNFENGLGGFTPDGREYIITLLPGRTTPAPWVNVLANPAFGTVISDSGTVYTWSENAHEFRLTPWSNDAVQDPPGEALYLRDEETGEFWSPTPAPARGPTPYVIRHGFGYTIFEHTEQGIASTVQLFVARDAAVKFTVVTVRNTSDRPRRITVTGYWEWVLGDLRSRSLLHVQTEIDLRTGSLLARNPYHADFPDRIVFLDVHDPSRTVTGDRREFLGRNGTLAQPAALRRTRLSGRVGAGLDPCGALQVTLELAPGAEEQVVFRLGVGRTLEEVQSLIHRFRRPDAARTALKEVTGYWERTLGTVRLETPDPAVNALGNGWLLYQTLSARLFGRTGFYQSGGAYGFRDQLQDVLALVHAEPGLIRQHLIRAAAHQFREGDVQHWWHPPGGRGVRTHFSDDYLWLPFAICRYVNCVGDTGVLDEPVPFLEGRPVKPEEESYFDQPSRSNEVASLYQHGIRAIERALRFGSHGLPLMGGGDWNDGMNRVGSGGTGESVWLGFFLFDVLTQFARLATAHGDPAFAERCLVRARQLQVNLEAHAWDGAWYRRAYFDNGDPLGSQSNVECRIDSLPQSWAVISGAADPVRARTAMESVETHLIRRRDGLIRLFHPPFDHSPQNPGYIQGYLPGVRENGGQYTHGALWTVLAFALQGDAEKAWELFALLNPIHHGDTAAAIATYKVEPYVVAADIYAEPPHVGRGGWTWYTGAAGWMYRLLLETLLGVQREGDRLRLAPLLPASWPGFTVHYRYYRTTYRIVISRVTSGKSPSLSLDGVLLAGPTAPLLDDQQPHRIELWLA